MVCAGWDKCPNLPASGCLYGTRADMGDTEPEGRGTTMGSQTGVIRVALIDDDPDNRLLVRVACDLDPRYALVGEFATLAEAVPGLLTNDVDVVIVDRLNRGHRSLELLAQLRVAVGRARIVVVEHADEPVPATLAVAAGADAFLHPTAFTRVADALRLASGRLEAA